MTEKIRILFLSANPWTTSRILVDEEAREIFDKLQEGPNREKFELYKHAAIRAIDIQRLLMMYEPHIVHFSGHGSKTQKIILGGAPGRGKEVDRQGLVEVFALYKAHVRLVVLNACFTRVQARSLAEVIDYSVGTGAGIKDKAGVAFAGAFYRALGFGRSVKDAFESAKAELGLTKIPRANGMELFVRNGLSQNDPFPQRSNNLQSHGGDPGGSCLNHLFACDSIDYGMAHRATFLHENSVLKRIEERSESRLTIVETSIIGLSGTRIRSEVECYNRPDPQLHVRPMLTGTGSPVPAPMTLGRGGSRADLKRLGKTKRAKRVISDPTEDEAGLRPAKPYVRACEVVIVKVRRVLLTNATGVFKQGR